MSIWTRLKALEREMNWRKDEIKSTDDCAGHLRKKVEKLDEQINGEKSRCLGSYFSLSQDGVIEKIITLQKTVKQQGDIIDQLAALHDKEITDPVKSVFCKVLVDRE